MRAFHTEVNDLACELGEPSFDKSSRKRRGFFGLVDLFSNTTLKRLISTVHSYSSTRRRSKDSNTRATTPNGTAGVRSGSPINVYGANVAHMFLLAYPTIITNALAQTYHTLFVLISRGEISSLNTSGTFLSSFWFVLLPLTAGAIESAVRPLIFADSPKRRGKITQPVTHPKRPDSTRRTTRGGRRRRWHGRVVASRRSRVGTPLR